MITRINNCLPLFPKGVATSKFSDAEIVSLLECLYPPHGDLKGYVPALEDKAKLIAECEALERHESENKPKKDVESSKNKKHKKTKFVKNGGAEKKSGAADKDNAFL